MKNSGGMRSFLVICLAFLVYSPGIFAQEEKEILEFNSNPQPVDGILSPTKLNSKRVLKYAPIRETDVLWEKRIWREIDTREKMNLTFRYPEKPFFSILKEGVEAGNIIAYSPEDDKFSAPLQIEELNSQFYRKDTVLITDPISGDQEYRVVESEINANDITRYRVKEVWFFDSNLSTMRVRILGIAPINEVYDEEGNFLYEYPLFWIYYPHCRQYLSNFTVFNEWNDKAVMTWEDLFEMRFFASFITKQSNAHDRRLQDYLSGRDLLLEGEKIKMEIFNYEHDLWSY